MCSKSSENLANQRKHNFYKKSRHQIRFRFYKILHQEQIDSSLSPIDVIIAYGLNLGRFLSSRQNYRGCTGGRPGFTMGLAGLKPGAPWQAQPRIHSKKI